MVTEEQTQPQVEETQVEDQAGTDTLPEDVVPSQPEAETPAETQPGAETEPRAYTQEEVSRMQAASDQENARLRRTLAERDLRREMEERGAEEARLRAEEARAVQDGDMTEAEARQNQQRRHEDFVRGQERRRQVAAADQMITLAETEIGPLAQAYIEALEVAKEDGLSRFETMELFNEILKDERFTKPEQLTKKIQNIRLKRRDAALKAAKQKPETFDSGQMGSTGASVDSMSPTEKIAWALEHPPRKK